MKRHTLVTVMATALLVAVFSGGAFAKGPPHPPGEEEEGANNLSVPAIFVPSTAGSPFSGTCTDADNSQDPFGDMGVEVDGIIEHPDYFVQGVATWQSDCDTADADEVTVGAEWGDNLTNAPLKAGTPIRTEIGFLADADLYPMPGYTVVKLDPTLLDRESHYGTLGNEVESFAEVRVWGSGVTLDIRSKDGTVVVADNIPYSAEVNSTGRVVYGFNWHPTFAQNSRVSIFRK